MLTFHVHYSGDEGNTDIAEGGQVARHSSESFVAPVNSDATSNHPKHKVSNLSMLDSLSTEIPNFDIEHASKTIQKLDLQVA